MLVEFTIFNSVLSSLGPNTKPCKLMLLQLVRVALVNVVPPIEFARINTGELKLIFFIDISPEPVTTISSPPDTVANTSFSESGVAV